MMSNGTCRARALDHAGLYDGPSADCYVKATALDARKLGFDTWVIDDGCRPVEINPGDGDKAFAATRAAGAAIFESGSIGA